MAALATMTATLGAASSVKSGRRLLAAVFALAAIEDDPGHLQGQPPVE